MPPAMAPSGISSASASAQTPSRFFQIVTPDQRRLDFRVSPAADEMEARSLTVEMNIFRAHIGFSIHGETQPGIGIDFGIENPAVFVVEIDGAESREIIGEEPSLRVPVFLHGNVKIEMVVRKICKQRGGESQFVDAVAGKERVRILRERRGGCRRLPYGIMCVEGRAPAGVVLGRLETVTAPAVFDRSNHAAFDAGFFPDRFQRDRWNWFSPLEPVIPARIMRSAGTAIEVCGQ